MPTISWPLVFKPPATFLWRHNSDKQHRSSPFSIFHLSSQIEMFNAFPPVDFFSLTLLWALKSSGCHRKPADVTTMPSWLQACSWILKSFQSDSVFSSPCSLTSSYSWTPHSFSLVSCFVLASLLCSSDFVQCFPDLLPLAFPSERFCALKVRGLDCCLSFLLPSTSGGAVPFHLVVAAVGGGLGGSWEVFRGLRPPSSSRETGSMVLGMCWPSRLGTVWWEEPKP